MPKSGRPASRPAGRERLCAALALTALLVLNPLPAAEGSLYQRLGGSSAIERIVDQLIDQVAGDPRLNRSFDKVDLARVKDLLAEQLCELSDGPCEYSGESMELVHGGLGITQAEFNGMVSILITILQRERIGLRERNELLRLLAPMKRDIVER